MKLLRKILKACKTANKKKYTISQAQKERMDAHSLGTDLVEVTYSCACCEKCAMYRGRVFSLHGKDRRFPLFPKDFHRGCGLSTYPFVYGVSSPAYCKGNIIKYSNRPFVDDRTEKERADYQAGLQRAKENKQREKDRAIYEKLVASLPNEAPKSFAAYRRIKKAGGKTFAVLKKKAWDIGLKL